MNISLTYSGRRLKKIYKWDKFISTKDWVEDNVILSSSSSPIGGSMDLSYTPHLIEIFDDFDNKNVYKQVLPFSSQTAKTTIIFCLIGKVLDTDPSPCQLMIPTSKGIPKYLAKKFNPFFDGVKCIKNKLMDYKDSEKVRDRGSELRIAGGGLSITGSSRGDRKSLSTKYFFGDEIAEFEQGAVVESIERTKSYEKFFRKIVLVSTMENDMDEINNEHNSCDTFKRLELKCSKCNNFSYFTSKHLKYCTIEEYKKINKIKDSIDKNGYKKYALDDVYLECSNCKNKISNKEKDDAIIKGEIRWKIYSGDESGKSIGYKANALSMYFTSLESIVSLLIDAEFSQSKLAQLDKIYRGYLNEIYKQNDSQKLEKNEILLCSNEIQSKNVPVDTSKIYLTIDTQKDGFWYKITSFSYGFNSNVIMKGFVETFDELEILMSLNFEDDEKKKYNIDKVAIDRMGILERTAEVDAWLRYLIYEQGLDNFIFPTIGFQNDKSGRLWYYTEVKTDVSTKKETEKKIKAIRINNTLIKNELNEMIKRSISNKKGKTEYKTRLFYINKYIVDDINERYKNGIKPISKDYESQMTSEHYIYKKDKKTGRVSSSKTWEKINESVDNHYFDCSVQALCLAIIDNISLIKVQKSDNFKEMLDMF